MANIREHCSWVHDDKTVATKKASLIIKTIVEKVKYDEPLEPIQVNVTKRAGGKRTIDRRTYGSAF
jgi:heterodisulfide reductase subunit A